MLRKCRGVGTVDVAELAATEALFVKMAAAIATLANVLVDVSVGGVVSEFLQNAVIAKRRDMAVDTAFSALGGACQSMAKLVGGKLAVGMQDEIVEE